MAFGSLFRLEFEYAGLNVGKNKFGLNFFYLEYAGLNGKKKKKSGLELRKKKILGLNFFFFFVLVGPRIGPNP